MEEPVCSECEEPFSVSASRGRRGMTCSKVCAKIRNARTQRELYASRKESGEACKRSSSRRACGSCGVMLPIHSKTSRQVPTCVTCRKLARMKPCVFCGETFEARLKTFKYCSRKCANGGVTPSNTDEDKAERRRSRYQRKNHRRRARLAGVPSEPYTLDEIAHRDKYTCQLCDDLVIMNARVPDPDAPTVDHIVALANGGHDVPDNVQLAHFLCNVKKGTK